MLMTPKERFLRTLQFQSVDRIPFMEIALWQQTRERWIGEGMPAGVNSGFMHRGDVYFGLEGYETVHIDAVSPRPPFESRTLAEDAEQITFIDGFGRTRRARKTGTVGGQRMSMDTYIEFPVKDRAGFERMRERYENALDSRYPDDWDRAKTDARATDLPLTLMNPLAGTFGYYSMLRNWMGTEGLSYMFYDDPALVKACLEFLTEFAVTTLERAVTEVKFDFCYIHEDMSFKNGPLISPALFKKLFIPQYERFIGFLRSHGVEIILVDTDGNHEVLLPLFRDVGIDGFGPVERAADMDPVALRKQYGQDFCMVGGVDKREIAKGRKAIEREIENVVRPLLDTGGFIPTIDHAIPPEVSLDDFKYYLELKHKAIHG